MTVSRKEQILKMLESNPLDSFLLFALAKELENELNWSQAKEVYEKIIQHDDSYVGAYYHYAKALEELNETEAAIEIYKKGISKSIDLKDYHSRSELESALMNLRSE